MFVLCLVVSIRCRHPRICGDLNAFYDSRLHGNGVLLMEIPKNQLSGYLLLGANVYSLRIILSYTVISTSWRPRSSYEVRSLDFVISANEGSLILIPPQCIGTNFYL